MKLLVSSNRSSDEFQYDIFISYNKEDVEFAEKLVQRLERDEYNGKKIKCFFSPWDIAPGENIVLRIEEGLIKSKFIGLILSPSWSKSNWTKLERTFSVFEDPAGLKGRIIPILRRNCDIPASIRILNWLDFRTDSNFEREINKMIIRVIGSNYRQYIKNVEKESEYKSLKIDLILPSHQEEILVSNLFQVIKIPEYLTCVKTRVKSRGEIWKILPEGTSLPIFSFNKETQELLTFSDLKNPQQKINSIISGPETNKIPILNIIKSNKKPLLIGILNRAMTAYMQNLGMIYDWKYKTRKTFFPLENNVDKSRYATWEVGGKRYERFLVKKTKSNKDFVHRSCKATFTSIGDDFYLKILPGWHFTKNGIDIPVSKRRMGSLSAKYMNVDRNHSIVNDLRFWIYKLSKGKDVIKLDVGSADPVLISLQPMMATIDKGVEGDYRERLWFEGEPTIDFAEDVSDEDVLVNEEEVDDTDEL